MKIESLHLNMRVRHPQYGVGTIRKILEHTADVYFDDGLRTIAPESSGLEPAEAQASVTGLDRPLQQFVDEIIQSTIAQLGIDLSDSDVQELGPRWLGGSLMLRPADRTLQTKEVPSEVFFHKIVMMRNNLRVLEQKVNAHTGLSDGDKVELQQYITRCYGSMTTFNILFRAKEGQFATGASGGPE